MGEIPRPPVDSVAAPVPSQESRGTEHKVNSQYVANERNIPDDPEIIKMLKEWADVWGASIGEYVRQGHPPRAQWDEKLLELNAEADRRRTALEQSSLKATVDFLGGAVSWGRGEAHGFLWLSLGETK